MQDSLLCMVWVCTWQIVLSCWNFKWPVSPGERARINSVAYRWQCVQELQHMQIKRETALFLFRLLWKDGASPMSQWWSCHIAVASAQLLADSAFCHRLSSALMWQAGTWDLVSELHSAQQDCLPKFHGDFWAIVTKNTFLKCSAFDFFSLGCCKRGDCQVSKQQTGKGGRWHCEEDAALRRRFSLTGRSLCLRINRVASNVVLYYLHVYRLYTSL